MVKWWTSLNSRLTPAVNGPTAAVGTADLSVGMLLFRAAATSVLSRHLLGGIFPNVFSPSYALSQYIFCFLFHAY